MPDPIISREALLRLPEVKRMTGLSETVIYERMGDGTFPLAKQVGPRTIAWPAGRVLDWLEVIKDGDAWTAKAPLLLLTREQIVAAAKDQRTVGVYFLIANGEIIYVGQSRNVFGRVAQHRVTKVFDAWHFIACEPNELGPFEAAYIKELQPRLNVVGIKYERLYA